MIRQLSCVAAAVLASLVATVQSASAHPHVWVTMRSELVYGPDGTITGIRHAWTFDDMFSAFATQGIDSKQRGVFTREELEPLAKTNVESLKDFDYFTIAKVNGKKADLVDPPTGYYLDYKDQILTLHFTLAVEDAAEGAGPPDRDLRSSYFVDFSFEKDERGRAGRGTGRMQDARWRVRRRWTRQWRRSCSSCRPTRSSVRRRHARRAVRQPYPGQMFLSCAKGAGWRAWSAPRAVSDRRRRDRRGPAGRRCHRRGAGAGHARSGWRAEGRPSATPYTGIVGWIMVKQAEFYKGLSGAIRAAKTDNSALWVLFGLSFAYGIFHAAGPGHGKAVISSYVVANRETWWRGVVLSFASAMVQAAVAVVVVGIAAVLLNATAATMKTTVYWIEIVSYSLIIAIGLRLLWAKGRAAIATWNEIHRPKTVGAAATPTLSARSCHAHHDHGHVTASIRRHHDQLRTSRPRIIMTTRTRTRHAMITRMTITTMTIAGTTTVRRGAMRTRRNRAS